ncbi:MAG: hypothetical protein AMJ94_19040 [Deltaproteobacteria bacterium SM23_61]|nr:MAG: hypothetical protein AMJ94_19040 [Deltaproteobacteria bacterium SM23_61]
MIYFRPFGFQCQMMGILDFPIMPRSAALLPGQARPSIYEHLSGIWKVKGEVIRSGCSPVPFSV